MDEKRNEKTEQKSEPKRRVGPFELERKLGVGGMGVVYLATYLKNGRKMAVKVLAPEMSADGRLLKRFLREMAILSRLRHPHIVRYYGGGKDKTQHFYAMEYMDGGSVEQMLKKKGRFAWDETIAYSRQVVLALEYAHNHGIIHRDLKPANLFMGKDGLVKLGDFGIARDTQATALTAAGRTVGTYAYMAPEQISGKPPVSRKTDLYALGCVMFEMLTGKPPFNAPTAAEMLFAHLEEEPPQINASVPDCPVCLDKVVSKLLEKDPEERYYDALALQVALDEVTQKVTEEQTAAQQTIAGNGSGATVQGGAVTGQTVSSKKKKKKKKKVVPVYERTWFLGTCLALLIIAILWGAWPRSEKQLFAQAQKLQAADDLLGAKDRYSKLFKSPEFGDQAREEVDKIDMEITETQALKAMRLNRESGPEAERLYIDALRFEQFKDRITALAKYRSLVVLLKDREQDRKYVNLAKKKIREIEESGGTKQDLISLVNDNLKRADDLATKGELLEAQNIWNSVVTLYGANRELEQQVTYARARLKGDKIERTIFGLPKAPTKAEPPKEGSDKAGPAKEKP
ncbi:MAG TPA: serine/threonine-protein kinase [Planctomycetaceae bacterium]|nr:serine/threonine-protein kinase [Planctomycetaceae bacterium]